MGRKCLLKETKAISHSFAMRLSSPDLKKAACDIWQRTDNREKILKYFQTRWILKSFKVVVESFFFFSPRWSERVDEFCPMLMHHLR